jgi:hypothetical protein
MTGSGTQRSYLEFPVRVDSSRLPSVRPMARIGAERKLILGIGCFRFCPEAAIQPSAAGKPDQVHIQLLDCDRKNGHGYC